MNVLSRNKQIFSLFKQSFLYDTDNTDPEIICERISKVAWFAFKSSVGVLYDSFLENCLIKISAKHINQQLEYNPIVLKKTESQVQRKKNIFIVSHWNKGGHITLLKRMVISLNEFENHIIFTDENGSKTPLILETFKDVEVKIFSLENTKSYLTKAGFTKLMCNNVENIIVIQSANDCIPTLAFCSEKNKKNLFYINHADHAFWLGKCIAQNLIEQREEGLVLSKRERKINSCGVLSLPISLTSSNYSKEKQNIIAVAMGAGYKFKKMKNFDFFKTWLKILERQRNLKLFLIGPEDYELRNNIKEHPQVTCFGLKNNPKSIIAHAHLAVDPIPFSSYTSILEICSFEAVPIFSYKPLISLFDLSKDPSFKNDFKTFSSEKEYIDNVLKECSDIPKLIRKGKRVAQKIKDHHSIDVYGDRLSKILNNRLLKKHLNTNSEDFFYSHNDLAVSLENNKNYELLLNYIVENKCKLSFYQSIKLIRIIRLLKGSYRDYFYILKKKLLK